jgi:hypothetical protein
MNSKTQQAGSTVLQSRVGLSVVLGRVKYRVE